MNGELIAAFNQRHDQQPNDNTTDEGNAESRHDNRNVAHEYPQVRSPMTDHERDNS